MISKARKLWREVARLVREAGRPEIMASLGNGQDPEMEVAEEAETKAWMGEGTQSSPKGNGPPRRPAPGRLQTMMVSPKNVRDGSILIRTWEPDEEDWITVMVPVFECKDEQERKGYLDRLVESGREIGMVNLDLWAFNVQNSSQWGFFANTAGLAVECRRIDMRNTGEPAEMIQPEFYRITGRAIPAWGSMVRFKCDQGVIHEGTLINAERVFHIGKGQEYEVVQLLIATGPHHTWSISPDMLIWE